MAAVKPISTGTHLLMEHFVPLERPKTKPKLKLYLSANVDLKPKLNPDLKLNPEPKVKALTQTIKLSS